MKSTYCALTLLAASAFSGFASQNTTVSDTKIISSLENTAAEPTSALIDNERQLTDEYFSQIKYRDKIRKRLAKLSNHKTTGLYWRDNDGRYYYYENDGKKPQWLLYRTEKPSKKGSLFIDPNTLSEDGSATLTATSQSLDGKYTACTITRNGHSDIILLDTESGNKLADNIESADSATPQWWADGFFYTASPRPEVGENGSATNIYYHKIGTPQTQDKLIYEAPALPHHEYRAHIPEGSNHLFVNGSGEGFGNSVMMKNLNEPESEWVIVEPSQNHKISIIGVDGDKAYILTSADTENNKLVTADIKNLQRQNWTTLIPETKHLLKDARLLGDNKLTLTYVRDAADHLYVYDSNGKPIREIKLPTFGSVNAWSSKKYPDDLFYTFNSILTPPASYRYDLNKFESKLLHSALISGYPLSDYKFEQVFFTSADGEKIPIYITHYFKFRRNGKTPAILYAVDTSDSPSTPTFSPHQLFWLQTGGVYAIACLRKNSVNDLIAAAEHLINEGYTSSDQLVIQSPGNGGMLIQSAVNQRPDLCKIAISEIKDNSDSQPCNTTALRSHDGSADTIPHPAILITTPNNAAPARALNFAANLRQADHGDAPILIRTTPDSNLPPFDPTSKAIDEQTDIYSFIFQNFGVNPSTNKEFFFSIGIGGLTIPFAF